MKQDFRELTDKAIQFRTDMNNRIFNELRNKVIQYENDDAKVERVSLQFCKHCYYIDDHIGLSAITTSYCGKCEKEMLNGSSDTDRLCMKCAVENNLCVHCGAKMD